jgi:hypothetical protein
MRAHVTDALRFSYWLKPKSALAAVMTYTSGIFGNVHLIFMGLMFFRPEEHRLSRDALDGVKVVAGVHRYVVIEGP